MTPNEIDAYQAWLRSRPVRTLGGGGFRHAATFPIDAPTDADVRRALGVPSTVAWHVEE